MSREEDKVITATSLILQEYWSAVEKHGPFNSAHEGYAVLLEEVDELWDEIRSRKHDPQRIREEAMQIAAMAMRMMTQFGDLEA